MRRMTESPYTTLMALGFNEWNTGGNCTALRRTYPDGCYHLITLAEDAYAPDADTPPDALVRVGFYGPEDSEPSADDFVDTFAAVVAEFREDAALRL